MNKFYETPDEPVFEFLADKNVRDCHQDNYWKGIRAMDGHSRLDHFTDTFTTQHMLRASVFVEHTRYLVHYCTFEQYNKICNKEMGLVPGLGQGVLGKRTLQTVLSITDGFTMTPDFDPKHPDQTKPWPKFSDGGDCEPVLAPYYPPNHNMDYTIYIDAKGFAGDVDANSESDRWSQHWYDSGG